jgi:hypothetical protein
MSQILNYFTFQDATTTAQSGNEYKNDSADVVTFEITGTSTSRTIIFEGLLLSGDWYPIQCANLSTLVCSNQTTGNNELWQVEIGGFLRFRIRVSIISGGNVTIKGKVM